MTQPIRALVVDDEPLARTHLRKLLSTDPDVVVVGECGNGSDAIAAIREQEPDLLYLDIQMPELDGFAVVSAVGAEQMPVIVFVTAHDEYALEAFRVHALDYLLKPVDRGRFTSTLERAKAQIRQGRTDGLTRGLLDWLDTQRERQHDSSRLAVRVSGRICLLKTETFDRLEAEDDHVRLYVEGKVHRVRHTMTYFEQRLPLGKFLRIHRSHIVNIDRIKEIQPWFGGDYVILLTDGTKLTSGRGYRHNLRAFLARTS
ncbi:MAG TPA: LytTR family DNA-binding domain-containing protein [Gemmatimonadaceae bacterium]|nr:LytTR family DNA-binding domain-containing protein [Gemmatimonadaceae bacterium]